LAEGEGASFMQGWPPAGVFKRISVNMEEHKVSMTVPNLLGKDAIFDLAKNLAQSFIDHLVESYSDAIKETMQQELDFVDFGERPLTLIIRSEPAYLSWSLPDSELSYTLSILSLYKILGSVSRLRRLYFDICKTCPGFFLCVAQHKHPQLCKIVTELS
jgi:hypothetical protein